RSLTIWIMLDSAARRGFTDGFNLCVVLRGEQTMNDEGPTRKLAIVALAALGLVLVGQTFAADSIKGQVLGSGAPIANSTVTLWAATSGPPAQLGQARTGADGRFSLNATTEGVKDASLYLVAKGGKSAADKTSGDNSAIALMAVVGSKPPAAVTINELTTVASVWTGAQFLKGDSLSGHALGLRIAAGNVPNLVDLATGGLGPVIQDPLNSTQTTDLSIFGTLGDLLAGCTTRVRSDACTKLFAASTPPGGAAPTDTLTAAEAIALHPWNKPATLFALLNDFYPAPRGPGSRAAPFRPYLLFAPSTW